MEEPIKGGDVLTTKYKFNSKKLFVRHKDSEWNMLLVWRIGWSVFLMEVVVDLKMTTIENKTLIAFIKFLSFYNMIYASYDELMEKCPE